MLRSPGSRRAVVRAALAGSMVLPSLAIVATSAGAGATDTFRYERQWGAVPKAINSQHVRLVMDDKARTAYVLHSSTAGLHVRAWDIDKLAARGSEILEPGLPGIRSFWPVAVVEGQGAVVVAPPTALTATPEVRIYDTTRAGMTKVGQITTRFPGGYAVLGLAVDAPRGRMLVLGGPSVGGNVKTVGTGIGNIMVDTWRLSDLAKGRLGSDLGQPVRVPPTCGQVVSHVFAAGITASKDGKSVYFGCLSNRGIMTPAGPNAGDVGGVAELDLAAAAAGTPSALRIRPISGDYAKGESFALSSIGRFVLVAGSAINTTVKVFDLNHGYYVGNVGVDNGISAIGFDTSNGRAYYINGSGIGHFDAGSTPVNQGVVYGDYAPMLGVMQRDIAVDPRTRRVLVATAEDVVNGLDPWIAVFRDGTEVPPRLESVNETGLDVDEVPNKFESRRSVDAAAMGAEFRMVGGPSSLLYNTSHFDSRGLIVAPGTRWMQLAATRSVRMTPDEASVQVVTMRYDDATAAGAHNTHLAEPVLCADYGTGVDEDKRADATTYCDTKQQRASGTVSAEPGRVLMTHAVENAPPEANVPPGDPVPAPVRVRHAYSSVDTQRAADGTLVATLHAEAAAVDILGTVQIGRVVADGSVSLHGRPGTAKAEYTRKVTGLVVNGNPVCDACPLDTVQDTVEKAFGGRVLVEFPEPDEFVSKRGTIGWVRDNFYRHYERTTFDEVAEDSYTSPAMEITVYLDGTASSRLIAGLAAVSALNTYRIQDVGEDPFPTDEPSTPPAPDPGTGGDTVDSGDGTITPVATEPGTPPVVAAPQPVGGIVDRLVQGLKIVFRSPRHLASVGALWTLLALPTYLAARRRLLLELPFLRRAVEES